MRKGNESAAGVNPVAKSVQSRDCKTKTAQGGNLARGVRAKRRSTGLIQAGAKLAQRV